MKNFNKKDIDVFAEVREDGKYYKGALLRTRLAVEVSSIRKAMDISQQDLAKRIETTQKIVSEVENGNVNVGLELLGRFSEKLNFNTDHFAKIFNCPRAVVITTEAYNFNGDSRRKAWTMSSSSDLKTGLIFSAVNV